MTHWTDIGSLEDIPVRGARVVRTAAGCIAVFRTSADEVYALDDTCPHKGGPLSEGIVHGASVTCPLHNRVFAFATGEAQGADPEVVATYPARIEAGRILLDLAALKARSAA
ncbi:nitrite reductase small subunit NirD [Mangrovicoccus algicola]|uniref:Nitrite reductase small subunit NirD n=1 Tax=Mangrovicoccus algicola TaxID=2771008 RepID=A0A8J6YUK8_9RHOB|nr:nitrite reductase small subunit NirD [Mangrovicoccus algicola]MBE3639558.1 nitrite reductase small subunit NirD [Mangrovicoccus algicola]